MLTVWTLRGRKSLWKLRVLSIFPKAAATSASVEKVNSKGRGNTGRKTLEIRAAKLRFLLIYEIMLKGIATTRSECTAKQQKQARQATTHTTLFLIWLTSLAMIEKRSKRRLKKFIIVKNIVLTKNWFVQNFWGFPEDHTKKCSSHGHVLLKKQSYFTTFRTF